MQTLFAVTQIHYVVARIGPQSCAFTRIVRELIWSVQVPDFVNGQAKMMCIVQVA